MDERYLKDDFDSCLAHVVEECGEVIAAAGKTQRFGRWSTHPDKPDGETNDEWLRRELMDLLAAVVRLSQVAQREDRR